VLLAVVVTAMTIILMRARPVSAAFVDDVDVWPLPAGGYALGNVADGSASRTSVMVAEAGTFEFAIRHGSADADAGGRVTVSIDGQPIA